MSRDSNMATMKRRVKHVVADSGAFIRNAPLREIGEQIYTIPEVVAEIKDKATKQRLQFLPYTLEYREPSPEAVKIVTEFSKKTGDYPSLSATDIKVLALIYHLEKEHVGTKHIKTTPDTKIEINLSSTTPNEPAQIAGFYLGTQKSSDSRTVSESETSQIDDVTSVLGRQTLSGSQSEDKECIASLTPTEQDSQVKPKSDLSPCRYDHTDVKQDTEKLAKDVSNITLSGGQKIYSEVRDNSFCCGHVNNLTDEDEFPSLASMSQQIDDINSNMKEFDGQLQNSNESKRNVEKVYDRSSPISTQDKPAWGVRQIHIEVKDESDNVDSHVSDESDFPALCSEEFPSLSQNLPSKSCQANRFSYAEIINEGKAKVQLPPATKRTYHEGQVLPSNIIQEEEEEEESEEEEEEVDEGIGEFDDEGWITPSNIKTVKKQMGSADTELAKVVVGCLTTDFAMQNVLIQMGLNVISVDGMLIKKAKSYVLRCFACFKVTSSMEKLFCPHCGNHTLKRIAMTVNDDGTLKYFFSRRKQLTTRGLRQSLPAPKGGKHASNPMLVADQPMPHQRPSRKALQSMDVFDPDFVASESPFSKHDVTSRASQLGIMRRGQVGGHRHQARGKKNSGRRK